MVKARLGRQKKASVGLSSGGVLNIILDPLFMFVILPDGQEVLGAALATMLSNVFSCGYLLWAFRKASERAPLSVKLSDAKRISKQNRKALFSVGIPSAILTGLFDVANICVNIIAAAHNDLVLAGMGIVMKIERVPNAVNIGICQGMLPIVAYNYSAGNRERMKRAINTARNWGLIISAVSILLFQLLAKPLSGMFLSTSAGDAQAALLTIGYAAIFLRIRCLASPVQLLNYHTSYCMQATGDGKGTMIHAIVRELVFYIPFMFILDALFGENGLASALVIGEGCGAVFALWMLRRSLRRR